MNTFKVVVDVDELREREERILKLGNTFRKTVEVGEPAEHPLWGDVTVLSKWSNSDGVVLHRVELLTCGTIRYAALEKGGV